MFGEADRTDYPLTLLTHQICNYKWHIRDDQLSVLFDLFNGRRKLDNPKHANKLDIIELDARDENLIGITNFPIRPLVQRISRFVHALLYHEWIPERTQNWPFIPLAEVDVSGTRPLTDVPQSVEFAKALCTAQKTGTASILQAYNGKFNYVATWSKMDNGMPICIYALDIYRIADLGVDVLNAPTCVVGFYGAQKMPEEAVGSTTEMNHQTQEVLYPLLTGLWPSGKTQST